MKRDDDTDFASDTKAQRVLSTLKTNAAIGGRVEPPAGYEAALLASLRDKLPLSSAPQTKRAVEPSRGFFAKPIWAWALSGVFAAFAMVTIYNHQDVGGGAALDLMAHTASRSEPDVVDGWVASLGDAALQRRVGVTDLDAAAEELSQGIEGAVADTLLRDMARSYGMK